ncbi:MAG: head GIN domain-containing protein [Chitinophagales bacterium]
MKKLFLFLVISGLSCGALWAQRTINDANAEKRNVSAFHGINVGTGIKLILTQGNTEDVVVSADKIEFRDKIVTRVEGGILKIYFENKLGAINTKKEKKELKAYVSFKSLDQLDANTGAQVQVEGTMNSSTMKMRVNTGATIEGTINTTDLEVDQNTGSVVTLSGDAGKIVVHGDTGAMFKGIDLKTDNCNVTASTGAGVYITVQKELSVRANTGGYVKYKGEAGVRDIRTNTGGFVSKI